MIKPELLAPAGNWDSLVAAIQNGADAVYLGATKFGARSFADNFSDESISLAADYAHKYGAKIYVTLNTILYPNEIEDVLKEAQYLASIGVDGVLVQDLGLAELLHKRLPGLPLHASTQMHIHSLMGVRMLENMGFTRVVLARETPIEEIRKIALEPIEVEIFVYGALCVCYSGQCYLSLDSGDRSGNRGQCAQPCRMTYKLLEDGKRVNTNGDYLLSPKDLYTLDRVQELLDLGVACWKIEGRMKRPEYVGFITGQYRKAIDTTLAGNTFIPNKVEAEKLFNRGFTNGHIFNMRGTELMNPVRPNHQGILEGEVIGYEDGQIIVKLSHVLHQHDGLRIIDTKDVGLIANKIYLRGRLVNSAMPNEVVRFDYPQKVSIGSPVLLTTDYLQMKEVRQTYEILNRHEAVSLTVKAHVGSALRMTAVYKSIILVLADSEPLQKATKHVLDHSKWNEQLSRTLDTPYKFEPIIIEADEDVFVPISKINDLRRRIVERLEQRLIAKPETYLLEYKFIEYKAAQTSQINVVVHNNEQYEAAKAYPYPIFTDSLQLYHQLNETIGLSLPRVNESIDFSKVKSAYINEPGQLDANIHNKYASLYFNVTNAYAVRFLQNLGCISVELSRELTDQQITQLVESYQLIYNCPPNLSYYIYGARDLMVTKYCAPNTYLTEDQHKKCGLCSKHKYQLQSAQKVYPLEFDEFCMMHIQESQPFDRIADVNYLKDLGVNNFRISFTSETALETIEVLNRIGKM